MGKFNSRGYIPHPVDYFDHPSISNEEYEKARASYDDLIRSNSDVTHLFNIIYFSEKALRLYRES